LNDDGILYLYVDMYITMYQPN